MNGGGERLRKALRALTREPRLDYLALYPARVLNDHGDMHLDLEPVDRRLPPMVRVPLRLFLPGAYVRVRPGALVLLGFEDGDPTRPVAQLWAEGDVVVVEVGTAGGRSVRLDDEAGRIVVRDPALVVVDAPRVELAGGGPAVARVGDRVRVMGVMPGSAVAEGVIISGSDRTTSG